MKRWKLAPIILSVGVLAAPAHGPRPGRADEIDGGALANPTAVSSPAEAMHEPRGVDRSPEVPPAATVASPEQGGSARPHAASAAAAEGEARVVEYAQVLARVGQEVVLASEIIPPVDARLREFVGQIPQSDLQAQRLEMVRAELARAIQRKMLYADARRSIPKQNWTKVEENVAKHFEEELPAMMERLKVRSRKELDEVLKSQGSSLERYRKTFIERTIAQSWYQEQVKFDEEVTEYELRKYYNEHARDYEFPARAKWQEILVSYRRTPGRAAAWAKLAELGNRVLRGEESFEEVARRESDGYTAAEGGIHDWTTRGSLVSEELDRQIFGLPIGAMSQILEDPQGLRIIRVLERKEAGRTSFEQVQTEIRKKIKSDRRKQAETAYLARLEKLFPVSTVFDTSSTAQAETLGSSARR